MNAPEVDVAIVGGGPAGLTCAAAIRRLSGGRTQVAVLEREPRAGGVPRHSPHRGFGLLDLHRALRGPHYAQRLVQGATALGVTVRTGVQVLACDQHPDQGALTLQLASPEGATRLDARAVVLTTGCRERPRAARLIAGERPSGVISTGGLQRLVELAQPVGHRAVVVGDGPIANVALATLARAGVETVARVGAPGTRGASATVRWGLPFRGRVPLLTAHEPVEIRGEGRVRAVLVRAPEEHELACDTVILAGDWVAEHELAVGAGLALEGAARVPLVDAALRTARPGLFAAGGVLHAGEGADTAALSGARAARSVLAYLETEPGPGSWPQELVAVRCEAPLQWVFPNAVAPGTASAALRGRRLLRGGRYLLDARVRLQQGPRVLGEYRLTRLTPNRAVQLPCDWVSAVAAGHGPVSIRVTQARHRGRRPPANGPAAVKPRSDRR